MTTDLRSLRLRLADFLVSRWLEKARRRMTLPVAVSLIRFLVPSMSLHLGHCGSPSIFTPALGRRPFQQPSSLRRSGAKAVSDLLHIERRSDKA